MAASMVVDQDNNRYIYKSDSSTNNYNYAVTFNTANTFVDKNIRIQIHPGTISPYFDNTNLATYFDAGTAGSNSISITPKATAVNGFINTLTSSNAQTGTAQYYTIKQAVVAADTADVALFSTDGSNAGVNISAIVGTKTTTEPSSGYYLAFKGSGNSQITTAGWVATGSLTSTTSGAKYFPITAAAITASSTNATATTTVAPGTVSISKNTTAVTNKTRLNDDDNDIYYKPVTATTNIDTYYIAIKANAAANSTGTTSSISGTTTASVTTAGYAPTSLTGSGSVSGTATAKTSSKDSSVYYIPIPTAVATITGTNTVSPSASLSSSNVTLSDTNNGISVTATGGGTASVTASANITTAGYVPSGEGFKTQTLNAANNTITATKYISAITIPANKSLTITNNGTATMTTSGTANITSTGTTTVTSNSTSAGTITIAAKTAAGDSSNTSQVVVQNGLWKTTAITAAGTYYGRVTVGSATVTTSSTNDGMTTYFTSGTSSDKNVTITPKYTNTAGYKAAVTTATNNGGTTYWKIIETTPSFSGGGLTGKTSSATVQNLTTNTETDNGIYIQTKGTAGRAAVTYTNTAGWLAAHSNATNASSAVTASTWDGEKYYVTAVTVPKDIAFSVTTTADTALDTTSDLNITNAAYRQIKITNAGSITTTQSAKSGTIKVNAYDTSSSSSLGGEKIIVEGGAWKTTTITTKPSSATAYYGRVYVNLNTTSVNTNGVTTISGTTATRPTATWGNGWITSGSIAAATFGSAVASGKTDDSYVDISSTTAAPILTAGGFLYINKGFTDNVKISLAKLVPDSISDVAIATSEWIHPSYGAFDAAGNEIRGTMTIYAGAYTLET